MATEKTLETSAGDDGDGGASWSLCYPGGGDAVAYIADYLSAAERDYWASRIVKALDLLTAVEAATSR